MNYYRNEGNNIFKFIVSYDENKIKQLREEIIENCGTVNHKEYITIYLPYLKENERIRNLKKTFVETKPNHDLYAGDDDVYKIEYDEVVFPRIIELIDFFLNGHIDALKSIENFAYLNNQPEEELIKEEQAVVSAISLKKEALPDKIEELKVIEARLKSLQDKHADLKKSQKLKTYYEQILEDVSLTLVDRMTIDEFNKYVNFFGTTPPNEIKKMLPEESKSIKK